MNQNETKQLEVNWAIIFDDKARPVKLFTVEDLALSRFESLAMP